VFGYKYLLDNDSYLAAYQPEHTVSPFAPEVNVIDWCAGPNLPSPTSADILEDESHKWSDHPDLIAWLYIRRVSDCPDADPVNNACGQVVPEVNDYVLNGRSEVMGAHLGSDPPAVTCVKWDGVTGAITEFDQLYNIDLIVPPLQIGSVGIHEWGHVLGLDHDCDGTGRKTMCDIPGDPQLCPGSDPACLVPQFDDLNGVYNLYADWDGDGCTNLEENAFSHVNGGEGRSDGNWYDFFDVPVPALKPGVTGTKNGAITMSDVLAITSFVGTYNNGPPNSGGYDYDTDINGNGIEDGAEYDRIPNPDTTKPWIAGPPNGLVSIQDMLVANVAVGDACSNKGP